MAANFELLQERLVSTYGIHELQAACYLCNYKDDYICCKLNGGCKDIEICRSIREIEPRKF